MRNNGKIVFLFLFLSFFSFVILDGLTEKVNQFSLELEYSKYVQNIIDKFYPDALVSVSIFLQKDSTLVSKTKNFNIDKQASLPGLPVANTTTYIPIDKNNNPILPATITSIHIKIFLPSTVKKIDEQLLKKKLSNLLKLSEDDEISIDYYTPFSTKKNRLLKNNIYYLIFLILFLFFILNFRSGIRYIGKTVRRAFSSFGTKQVPGSVIFKSENATSPLPFAQTKGGQVLRVKLIRENKKKSESNLDFSFLTDLPYEKLMDLLKDEPIEDLPIILSVMPNDFCIYFCKNYKGPMEKLIANFYSIKNRPKIDLKLLRVSLYQKYINMLEKDTIRFNGEQRLFEIVKQLPYTDANQILYYIKKVNKESFKKISEGIITIDKILELNEIMLEEIVAQVEHSDFVKFLKIVDDKIKRKFYSNFSKEVINYLEKEINEIGEISKEEKNRILNVFVNKIRELLEK